jgi:DNA invertase Pin-like site-specific DNA recombinase
MAVTPVPTICGLYTRVSTRNQADTEYSSLETQREKLEAYCKSQDQYVIYRVYEDAGFSADTMNRPALKELTAGYSGWTDYLRVGVQN